MKNRIYIRWQLVFYDALIFAAVEMLLFGVYCLSGEISVKNVCIQAAVTFVCVFAVRFVCKIYSQIWRYGGIQSYMRLLIADGMAFLLNLSAALIMPSSLMGHFSFERLLAVVSLNLLCALAIRMIYRYAYKCGNYKTARGKLLGFLLRVFSGIKPGNTVNRTNTKLVNIAIVGAGRAGVCLAEELLNDPNAAYSPKCFIDIREEKVNRHIQDMPVFLENESTLHRLKEYGVQEIVFAIPSLQIEEKKRLYEYYKRAGYTVKTYDFAAVKTAGGKIQLREFDIEELLFRKPLVVSDEKTNSYYKDKVILITGGGGSIGSEMCRQLAKMSPKQLVVLDIYENGAYDIQQELKMTYKGRLDLRVEIVSVCNKNGLERVFSEYRPQVVIGAAAHKHVPLMEKNCIEAVENNVFGTLNTVELSEKYGVERFIMVSTDKAVNPTNIMGATKRICEMIVQSHGAKRTATTFSATRFGNVLGSAGSVIPLFKRQILNGGPVTVTDKRIVRYFMTMPEASQLVLQSGAMAKNGELFALDMGKPVKILDLAENMIRLAGLEPYKDMEIIETGLRPGEKLYEELLVKTEELSKTDNSLIFVERDVPLDIGELNFRLDILRKALNTGDDDAVKNAVKQVVPTYCSPEEINANAAEAAEMQNQRIPVTV